MVNPMPIYLYLLNISSSRHSVTWITLKGRPPGGSSDSANTRRRRFFSFFFKQGHLRQFAAAVHNMKIMCRFTLGTKNKKRLAEKKECRKSQQRRTEYKCAFYVALGGEFAILRRAFVGRWKSAPENIRSMFRPGFPGGHSCEGKMFCLLTVMVQLEVQTESTGTGRQEGTKAVLIPYWNTTNKEFTP